MSRRSRRRRKRIRNRKRARLQRLQLQAIQLPPKRSISTWQLVELIKAQQTVISSVLRELESQSK
jgi:hypothetical protein